MATSFRLAYKHPEKHKEQLLWPREVGRRGPTTRRLQKDKGTAPGLRSRALVLVRPSGARYWVRRTTSAARRLSRRVSSRALSYFGRSSP